MIKQFLINIYQKLRYLSTYRKRTSFKILSSQKTIDYIIKERCSVARFGDGEFKLAMNSINPIGTVSGLGFQQFDQQLGERLYEILSSPVPNIKIGLPSPILGIKLNKMTPYAKEHWKNQTLTKIDWIFEHTYKDQLFLDSFFTRFYIDFVDHRNVHQYVEALKKIWEDRDLLIVEGSFTRLGVGNDLFENTHTIERIICPATDAFCKIVEIEKEIIDSANSNTLVLLALGPTATVVVADLAESGIQMIDIGHVDIEYEWMKRNATKKIPIPGKYVNEARNNNAFDDINSDLYEYQIIKRIEINK